MRITCDTKDTLPLSALTEFQGGLKKRTADDIAKIEKSIREYGFATPFFVWRHKGKNLVLDGHGRLQTLKEMAAHGEEIPALPVVYIDCPNEAAAKNLLLRICSTYGEMTADTVKEFLGGLEINLEEIKLPDGMLDLSAVLDDTDTKGDDDAPSAKPEEPAQSKAGETYQLGDHRLICGDSTDAETLAALMGGAKADLVLTDPPYNVNLSAKNDFLNRQDKGFRIQKAIENDKLNEPQFKDFLKSVLVPTFSVSKAGAAYYIFYAQLNGDAFISALKEIGYKPHQCLVWVKNNFSLSPMDYKWAHEPIVYGWKDGSAHKFYGAMNLKTVLGQRRNPTQMDKKELVEYVKLLELSLPSDVIYYDKPIRNAEHPTAKPVGLLQQLITNSSKREDVILDPFGGSGSTLIAAAKTGRTARLCEIDPHYCDVIRKRWTKWAKENGYAVGTGGLE